jgi:TctA family transporter
MDAASVLYGFAVALAPANLWYCFVGVLLGTLVGVLPGLGPLVTISLLLPFTYGLSPASAIIMLAGIYYGASYGGSTTAILVNLPGEPSSIVTCLDGHAMAKQGRAGPALAIAAFGSFAAGCIATVMLAVFSPALADVALSFGSPEYFCLMMLGLLTAAVLTHGSLARALAMTMLGLLVGLVGTDIASGTARYTFGMMRLADGLDIAVLVMGLFGLSEIILNIDKGEKRDVYGSTLGRLMPSRADLRASCLPVLRGTAVGSGVGILPGAGTAVSSFLAYALERRFSRTPERFGHGAIEGVASPEAANNAAAQMSFIPTLTLGIPGSGTMALMLGALMMNGVAPGPMLISSHPDLFWGLIASMLIGNAMLLVLNLPLVGIWVRLLSVPYRFLFPTIILVICVGVYSINNSALDVLLTAGFGAVGFFLCKLGFEPTPLILGFILGPAMEENLRRSLLLSRGDPSVFLTRPASLGLLILAVALLATVLLPSFRRRKDEILPADLDA